MTEHGNVIMGGTTSVTGDLILQGAMLLKAVQSMREGLSPMEFIVRYDADEEEIRIESHNGLVMASLAY